MLFVCDDLVKALNNYLENPTPIETQYRGKETRFRIIVNIETLEVRFDEN